MKYKKTSASAPKDVPPGYELLETKKAQKKRPKKKPQKVWKEQFFVTTLERWRRNNRKNPRDRR
jgi:hypothetical protein